MVVDGGRFCFGDNVEPEKGLFSVLCFEGVTERCRLQIFISFAACVIVFMLGYAVGGPVARKDKSAVIKELEEERLRKEQKKAKKANAKNK